MSQTKNPIFHHNCTPFDYGTGRFTFGSREHPLRLVAVLQTNGLAQSVKVRHAHESETLNVYTNIGFYLVRENLPEPLTKFDIERAMLPSDFAKLYDLFLCNNKFAQLGSYMHPAVVQALRLSVGETITPSVYCPKEVNAKSSLFPTA